MSLFEIFLFLLHCDSKWTVKIVVNIMSKTGINKLPVFSTKVKNFFHQSNWNRRKKNWHVHQNREQLGDSRWHGLSCWWFLAYSRRNLHYSIDDNDVKLCVWVYVCMYSTIPSDYARRKLPENVHWFLFLDAKCKHSLCIVLKNIDISILNCKCEKCKSNDLMKNTSPRKSLYFKRFWVKTSLQHGSPQSLSYI